MIRVFGRFPDNPLVHLPLAYPFCRSHKFRNTSGTVQPRVVVLNPRIGEKLRRPCCRSAATGLDKQQGCFCGPNRKTDRADAQRIDAGLTYSSDYDLMEYRYVRLKESQVPSICKQLVQKECSFLLTDCGLVISGMCQPGCGGNVCAGIVRRAVRQHDKLNRVRISYCMYYSMPHGCHGGR